MEISFARGGGRWWGARRHDPHSPGKPRRTLLSTPCHACLRPGRERTSLQSCKAIPSAMLQAMSEVKLMASHPEEERSCEVRHSS